MKTNLTKILVLVLSLALLVGAVIGISVSAEEYTYEIKSMNIVHGDTTVVLVAVDAPATGEAPAGVEVTYVNAAGETLTAKYYGDLDVYGTTYPVYYTKGIPAKDLGQDVIASVALDGDVKDTENVSVAEYLYGKLYKEEYINATAGKDLNKKNLYLNLLDYAASAETVLWNDKDANADNQRTLITDKFYVYAAGQIEDVLEPNETFTLNYGTAPEGYTFSGYWVSTINGTSVIKDGTAVKATAHAVYTPALYANEDVAGFYYTNGTSGARYDFSEDIVKEAYSAENPNGDFAGALNDQSNTAYTDGNSSLEVVDGALKYNMNVPGWTGFTLSNKGYNSGMKFVAEFDFTYTSYTAYTGSSSCDNLPFFVGLTKSNEDNKNYIVNSNQGQYTADHGAVILYNVPMVMGETYNVRIVYSAGTYSAYVDGVCTYSVTVASADSFAGLGFYIRSRHAGNSFGFELDNVYIGALSYYDDPEAEGIRYSFDNENTATKPSYIFADRSTTTALVYEETDESGTVVNKYFAETAAKQWGTVAILTNDDTKYASGKYVANFDLCLNNIPTRTDNELFVGMLGLRTDKVMTNDHMLNLHHLTCDGTSATFFGVEMELKKTYNVTVIYDIETDLTDIYFDGVLVGNDIARKTTYSAVDDHYFVGFAFTSRVANPSYTVDNVYFGVIDGVIAE